MAVRRGNGRDDGAGGRAWEGCGRGLRAGVEARRGAVRRRAGVREGRAVGCR